MPSSMNCPTLRLPRVFTPYQSRQFSSLGIIQRPRLQPRTSFFHSTGDLRSRKRNAQNEYFSSTTVNFAQQDAKLDKSTAETNESPQKKKRRTKRSQAAQNSLRRVAVEAQRSKDGKGIKKTPPVAYQATSKVRHPLQTLRQTILTIGNA